MAFLNSLTQQVLVEIRLYFSYTVSKQPLNFEHILYIYKTSEFQFQTEVNFFYVLQPKSEIILF